MDSARPLAKRLNIGALILAVMPLLVVGALVMVFLIDAHRPLLADEKPAPTAPKPPASPLVPHGGFELVDTVISAPLTKDPEAVALLEKVGDLYVNAASFTCEGDYTEDLQTARPVKLAGKFLMRLAKGKARVDWTDTQFDGTTVTSSVFIQDKVPALFMGVTGKWTPMESIESALGAAVGISHRVSYWIPTFFTKKNYIPFTSLAKMNNVLIDGVDCAVIQGTSGHEILTFVIDPSTYAIRQIKTVSQVDPAANEAEIAQILHRPQEATAGPKSSPSFKAVNVINFKNPVFDAVVTAKDFAYDLPSAAKKDEGMLK